MLPKLQTLPGSDVLYRHWPCPKPKTAVLLVHGLGAQTARFESMAETLNKRKIAVYAIELRGFGETKGPRGHIDSFKEYYRDIAALGQAMAKDNPDKNLFLLGDSMGGCVSLNFTAQHPDAFRGLVLHSPYFKNVFPMPLSGYVKTFTSIFYNPKNPVNLGFSADLITRDPEFQKMLSTDPREVRVASANFLVKLLLEQTRAAGYAKTFKTPVLFLLAGIDHLADLKTTRAIYGRVPSVDKTLKQYPGMLHAMYVDKGKEAMFADVADWLEKRA